MVQFCIVKLEKEDAKKDTNNRKERVVGSL